MSSDGRYDVIIIGSGAGGGTLARHLAPSGKRILILERGDWLPREVENWDSKEVFVENRYVPKETWYDQKDKPFQPGIHYAVGGATKMYGAALYRLRPEDFGELRHHDGISPAWPISLRRPGALLHEGRTPVRGPRQPRRGRHRGSRQHPVPVPGADPRTAHPAARRTTWSVPAITRSTRRAGSGCSTDDPPNSHCIRCATCDGFPCLVQAKSDAEMLGVRPALEHANVAFRTRAVVTRLETNAAGTAVERVDRRTRRYPGDVRRDIVVVSAGAANSAKLLLASATDRAP